MTNITIYHEPSHEKILGVQAEPTLTGYKELDKFFAGAMNMARCREIELEINAHLPEPLPITAEEMVQVLDELLKAVNWMTELASGDDLWAKLFVLEHGKSLRMECHTTDAIAHDASLVAKFVGKVSHLGGTADLDGNGETQILWAEFPMFSDRDHDGIGP